jgi:hypothetical protein
MFIEKLGYLTTGLRPLTQELLALRASFVPSGPDGQNAQTPSPLPIRLGGELQSWPEVFHAHLHHAHALDEPRLKNY